MYAGWGRGAVCVSLLLRGTSLSIPVIFLRMSLKRTKGGTNLRSHEQIVARYHPKRSVHILDQIPPVIMARYHFEHLFLIRVRESQKG